MIEPYTYTEKKNHHKIKQGKKKNKREEKTHYDLILKREKKKHMDIFRHMLHLRDRFVHRNSPDQIEKRNFFFGIEVI